MIFLLSVPVLFFLYFLYVRVYFSPVSSVHTVFSDGTYIDYYVEPVKPGKTFFSEVSGGLPYSFVPVGNGYFILYVKEGSDSAYFSFNDLQFSSHVYIFRRGKLGRFKSVDLSDRCLYDLIKKFK